MRTAVIPHSRRTDLEPRRAARWASIAVIIASVFVHPNPASAKDRVILRGPTGIGSIVLTGRVVDWTGQELKILETPDKLRAIDADRIESVDTVRLAAHVAGLKAIAQGKLDEARRQLTEALENEPRTWMRREILAQLVRVDLAEGDRISAGQHFLAIYQSDPSTFWFDRIPLEWRVQNLDFHGLSAARQWIESDKSEVSQLLGASLLLFEPGDNQAAVECLKSLAASPDSRVFPLARAQLWRRDLRNHSISRRAADRWANRLMEIPETLRGGPRFLVGHGYAAVGDFERAAANWLWLPLVHDQNPRLAAKAEVLAAGHLQRIGQVTESIVLYREVIERFGFTPSRALAEQALAKIAATTSSARANKNGEPTATVDVP